MRRRIRRVSAVIVLSSAFLSVVNADYDAGYSPVDFQMQNASDNDCFATATIADLGTVAGVAKAQLILLSNGIDEHWIPDCSDSTGINPDVVLRDKLLMYRWLGSAPGPAGTSSVDLSFSATHSGTGQSTVNRASFESLYEVGVTVEVYVNGTVVDFSGGGETDPDIAEPLADSWCDQVLTDTDTYAVGTECNETGSWSLQIGYGANKRPPTWEMVARFHSKVEWEASNVPCNPPDHSKHTHLSTLQGDYEFGMSDPTY